MDQGEGEDGNAKTRPRRQGRHRGDGQRTGQAVQELVVPPKIEKRVRMTERAIGGIDYDAESVEIRRDGGPREDRSIAMFQLGLLGDCPTG